MPDKFHGLIQHSFALQVPPELHPVYTRRGVADTERLLRALFETEHFELGTAGMETREPDEDGAWKYSLLASRGQTEVAPLALPFKESPIAGKPAERPQPLPPFAWAGKNCGHELWDGFVFGDTADELPISPRNDFLIEDREAVDGFEQDPALDASRFLAQLLANKRSHLFGLALGRSSFNILPPHAMLIPESIGLGGNQVRPQREWFVQPVLSLFHVFARRAFRPIFSFSLFMVPVARREDGGEIRARTMPAGEIHEVVKTQWPLATAFTDPANRPKFVAEGPLITYLGQAGGSSLAALELAPERDLLFDLTLREFTEATLFSLATLMAFGPRGRPGRRSRRRLGDRIVTSLSASRVTAVAVVDESRSFEGTGETEALEATLADLAGKIADPIKSQAKKLKKYRLDKPLFDRAGYVSAVLPDDRCIITVGARRVQKGLRTSLLLEAGWTAYQVIGAATATGLIRSIFREITISERADPDVIADIEGEAMVELHETYDIEITVEAHRRHYCLLREYLGIEKEYDALSEKLQALHRETATRAGGRSEQRLAILTWAIVVLSALILAGTLALIFKPGG
ncbi:MAG TPA: hypothetical protein VHA76_01285 [Solirubrobacterales bacterium]|nr:hypothetical protein [Solirubrobacterales bacterium]